MFTRVRRIADLDPGRFAPFEHIDDRHVVALHVGAEQLLSVGAERDAKGRAAHLDQHRRTALREVKNLHVVVVTVGHGEQGAIAAHRNAGRDVADGIFAGDGETLAINDLDATVEPVRHVEQGPHGIGRHAKRTRAGRNRLHGLMMVAIDHRQAVAVRIADVRELAACGAGHDASRALADADGRDHLARHEINDRHGVVTLVGDVGPRSGRICLCARACREEGGKPVPERPQAHCSASFLMLARPAS